MTDDANVEVQRSCDYRDPESVVSAFIAAMNRWEIACAEAQRASRDHYDWDWGLKTMTDVFDMYCTSKPRPFGRQASFQRPPEYDPEKEKILCSSTIGRKSTVDTERVDTFWAGKYRYTLFLQAGQWRIDNLKSDEDGSWRKEIL